jgi:hypothetical protein
MKPPRHQIKKGIPLVTVTVPESDWQPEKKALSESS